MELLRSKHNAIKYELLSNAVNKLRLNDPKKNITLLDLGVGRCNDVHKWIKLEINTIIGIDESTDQLEEAKKRSANLDNVILYHIDLSSKDIKSKLESLKIYKFDIIVSFFSIHYFIDNISKIISTINKSSECIFISTFLHFHLSYFTYQKYYENNYIFIKHIEKNIIEVKFKDAPYFNKSNSNEIIINDKIIKFAINKNIKDSYTYKNFLTFYNNINNLDDDLIITELMHGCITCTLKD